MVLLVGVLVLLVGLACTAAVRRRRRFLGRERLRHEPLPPTGRRRPGPMHPSASEIAVSRQEHGRRLPGPRW